MTLSEMRLDKAHAWCGDASVLPRDCGWYCDGHTLLKASAVRRPKPYMVRSTHDATDISDVNARPPWSRGGRPSVSAEGVQRILNGVTAADGEPWTVAEVLTIDEVHPNRGSAMVVLVKPPDYPFGAPVYLDAHKVKLIGQLCGAVEYRVADRNGPVILAKDGELIGLIMPLRA